MNQTASRPRICLAMIVRDAADFITQTLQSIVPYIDEWVIVDTGSVDNTKQVVQNFFDEAQLEGQLVERPWIGFAHNRTEAIALCAGRADYAFMIDADDLIEGNLNLMDLTAPGYRVRLGPHNVYWRPALFSLEKEWEFRGAVHEYAVCLDGSHTVNLEGDYNFIFRSLGNRGKDPLKFQRDIDVLLAEYEKDPNDPRTVFTWPRVTEITATPKKQLSGTGIDQKFTAGMKRRLLQLLNSGSY